MLCTGDRETKFSLKEHCPFGKTSMRMKQIPGNMSIDGMDIS